MHCSGLKVRAEEKSVKVAARSAVVEEGILGKRRKKKSASCRRQEMMLIKEGVKVKEVPAWRAGVVC